jgi:hypothetical protein
MPRGVAKANLPSKVCEVCNRPFTWRKVWENCWDEVRQRELEWATAAACAVSADRRLLAWDRGGFGWQPIDQRLLLLLLLPMPGENVQ